MAVAPELPADWPVLRNGDPAPPALERAFVAIGNFDGVHRGHRAVIDAAVARAKAARGPALALTFEPHPRQFFRPDEPLFRLTPEPAKLRLLAATGLAGAVVVRFDRALAGQPAEQFVAETLIKRLNVGGVAVGADFRFGKGRAGSATLLTELGRQAGFEVEIVPPLLTGSRPVSSGLMRDALARGRIDEAAELLGHSWFVEGEVIGGAKRGRELGFPTANLVLDPACTLRYGVYAVRAYRNGAAIDSVASFGRRPQFDDGPPLLEVHLLDFSGELYGERLTVEFVDFIRPESTFVSIDALVAEMRRDRDAARRILARAG